MALMVPRQRIGRPTAGSPLASEIVAEPGAGLLLDITGPGGCGKTPLLEAVARSYTDAGVLVVRDPGEAGDLIGAEGAAGLSGAAVLIDDAQRLDADQLARLEQLARTPGQRVIVAHRRWPVSPALIALGTALTARRPPVVLGHLDRPAIADRISDLSGPGGREPLAKLMHEQTAGLPVLLDQLVTGLRDSGQLSADAVRQLVPRTRLDVPAGVREQLRYILEALPPEVRDVLFAATLSTGSDAETVAHLLETDGPAIDRALQAAQATGLMTDQGAVVPLVGRLLLRLTPAAYTNRICERLAALQLSRGGSMLPAGQALLRTSARGPQVAETLLAAGQEALGSAPDLARRLCAAAAGAGAQSPALLVGRADAAARCGRLDEALRLPGESRGKQNPGPGRAGGPPPPPPA